MTALLVEPRVTTPVVAPDRRVLERVPLAPPVLVVGGILAACLVGALAGKSWVLGVAGLVAVAIGVVLAQRPILVAMIVVTLVPITSGLRRDLPIPGFRFSEVLTVAGAIVVLGLCARVLPGPRWRVWDWLALAYCVGAGAFGLLDSWLHQVPITLDDARVIAGPLQFFLLYRMTAAAFCDVRLRVIGMRLLLLASLPVSALAALQQVGPAMFHQLAVSLTGTHVFITPGYDPVRRATSVFPIWHALAGYLLIVLLLGAALILVRDRRVLPLPILGLVLGAAVVALIYSLTATVVVGFVVGVVVLGAILGRLRLVLVGLVLSSAVVLLLFFPLVSERIAAQSTSTPATASSGDSFVPQTLQYRFDIWTNEYLPALKGSWVNGYGPADPPNVTWTHTESGYLTILLRGGIGYIAIAGAMLYASYRAGRRGLATLTTSDRAVAATVMSLAVVLVIINFAFPYLTASGLPQPMWVVWGLLAAALGQGTGRTVVRAVTP